MENECVVFKYEYKIFPKPRYDETINGVIFKKENEVVTVIKSKNISEFTKNNDYFLIKSPEEEYRQLVEDLILLKAIHNFSYEPISVVGLSGCIYNKEYLSEVGIEARTQVTNSISMGYHLLKENDYFSDAVKHWNDGFKFSTEGYQNYILDIARWISRAHEETTEIKKFIMLYMAFNFLYSLFAKEIRKLNSNSPKDEIKTAIYILLKPKQMSTIYKQNKLIFKRLESFNIMSSSRKKENLSLALQGKLKTNFDEKVIITQAAYCVHQIRNEIFHYGVDVQNIDVKVSSCIYFLNTILPRLIRNFIEYEK